MFFIVIFLCEQILFSQQMKTELTAEGHIRLSNDDVNIIICGEPTVEGTGLSAGTVSFGGKAQASGSVIIIGSTAPSHPPPSLPPPEHLVTPPRPPLFTNLFHPMFSKPHFSPIFFAPAFFVPTVVLPTLASTLAPKLALALSTMMAPTLTPTLAPTLAPMLPPAGPPIGISIETVLRSRVPTLAAFALTENKSIPVVTKSDGKILEEDVLELVLNEPNGCLENYDTGIKFDVFSNAMPEIAVPDAATLPIAGIVPVSGTINIVARF